jgi:hypothetical protein
MGALGIKREMVSCDGNLEAGKVISDTITILPPTNVFDVEATQIKNHGYIKPNIIVGKIGYKWKTAVGKQCYAII